VDIGANVGYSVSYFANQFPKAHLVAFEPHPDHVRLLENAVRLNQIKDRVTIYALAAGNASGEAWLSDNGGGSQVSAVAGPGNIRIAVADIFELLTSKRIDLLKIDCEGGEYSLLMDPRFPNLCVNTIVLEWHNTQDHPRADVEISSRLSSLGWQLESVFEDRDPPAKGGLLATGILWAYR
jgi:FkbM family methyltransferase